MSCPESSCQICKFVSEMEESVVYSLSVQDVIDGSSMMPFANRIAWLATQRECLNLRRVHAHLSQGTRPSKRYVKIQDVKRYLQRVTIASDGLLVVVSDAPFRAATERIVVSRSVLHGLVTAVHLRFNHPSQYQMQQVMARYFYALDMEGAIKATCSSWQHCNSLKYIPPPLVPQSSCSPPDIIGSSFALDVMRRAGQCILILRETVSSYAVTRLIDNLQHQTFRDAILSLVTEMRSCCRSVEVWVDNASGLKAVESDSVLKSHDIILVFGEIKNVNKNPVAEYAVKELGLECLHICPEGGPVTTVTLALATANMNSRIRYHGLSAKEVWTQRDQVTGDQLALDDRQIILKQHCERSLKVGDLVYIVSDGDKTKAREKYLVTDLCSDNMCLVRKFNKSQFWSRSYKVKMCELYPVVPTTLLQHPEDTVRGLDNRQEAPLLSSCVPAPVLPFPSPRDDHAHTMPYGPPLPPSYLVIPPLPPSPGACDQPPPTCRPADPPPPPVPLETESHHSGKEETLPTTRVPRNRHPPKWQTDGEWLLD